MPPKKQRRTGPFLQFAGSSSGEEGELVGLSRLFDVPEDAGVGVSAAFSFLPAASSSSVAESPVKHEDSQKKAILDRFRRLYQRHEADAIALTSNTGSILRFDSFKITEWLTRDIAIVTQASNASLFLNFAGRNDHRLLEQAVAIEFIGVEMKPAVFGSRTFRLISWLDKPR